VPVAAAASNESSTDVYRRQARRLRCRFAGQPAMLQFALRALADAPRPAAEAAPEPKFARAIAGVSPLISAPAGSAREFAEFLIDRSPSAVLRYSERLELLRVARRRFGIGRFEANLLIATVLERQRRTPSQEEPAPLLPRGSSLLGGLTTFVLIQGAVLLGAWWTILR
jgi:hypothetical protein